VKFNIVGLYETLLVMFDV